MFMTKNENSSRKNIQFALKLECFSLQLRISKQISIIFFEKSWVDQTQALLLLTLVYLAYFASSL